MSDEGKSYRQILRSTSIIGGASVINILIGLVRVKVAAVLLGPAGVGLMGLFSNLIATAANVAALGMGTVGTRQIAEAIHREFEVLKTRPADFRESSHASTVVKFNLEHRRWDRLCRSPTLRRSTIRRGSNHPNKSGRISG